MRRSQVNGMSCHTLVVWAALATLGTSHAADGADDDALGKARRLLLRGKHAEAAEAYESLADEHPAQAVLGLARVKSATGEHDEAVAALKTAAADSPESADLRAELARLAFEAGDHHAAATWVDAAFKLDADHVLARWIQAELHRTAGRLDEAGQAYAWFKQYYNDTDFDDAEPLRWVGRAVLEHARWSRNTELFQDLVNDLYPYALELEPDFWPAHYASALIWLEKYNQAEATRDLRAALKINPSAAEIYAALARLALQNYDLDDARRNLDQALDLNPQLVEAHQLQADWHVANFEFDEAIAVLEKAVKLNPVSEKTLGRLAAVHRFRARAANPAAGNSTEMIVSNVLGRNPRAGMFFFTLATTLEARRKFDDAENYFHKAIELMPQLIGSRAALGMMVMRLGREDEGRKLLEESFEIDPFNVRVSNTLKVLDVLDGYETLETEHFLIRHDPKEKILARYAANYLEEVYPALCKQFAYEPPGKSLFEIFTRAKNTNGHGWFSARMIGLPSLGTVGACAGKMVAMASPNDMAEPFNWARVLKHEFVHVINLQQTGFNLPHWYAEALAVLNEGYPRSPEWNELLLARVTEGDIFNLDTINLGFIRPQSGDDWTLAYCQSELYAEYMLREFGEDSLAKMLTAFADNLTTREAVERSFGVSQEKFEKGYVAYLEEVVGKLSARSKEKKLTPAELEQAHKADPGDPDLAARLGYLYLQKKSYPRARKLAREALKIKPRHQLATYIEARLHLLVGDTREALELLKACLDRENPDEHVLTLLAGLRYRAGQFETAGELYELGARKDPYTAKWLKYLARVYLRSGEKEKLADVLARLSRMDADDLLVRKKLAQLAYEREDHEEAVRWAREALQIDVTQGDVHGLLGRAHAAAGDHAAASRELEVAVELTPSDATWRLELAKAYKSAKQPDKARDVLKELLERDPDNADAKKLLESLDP